MFRISSRRTLLVAAMVGVAVLGLAANQANADPLTKTVTVVAVVDEFAEWSTATTTFAAEDWTGTAPGHSNPLLTSHINHVGEVLTCSKTMTLYSNCLATITPTAGLNSGIATNASTDTLTTQYMLTGDNVSDPDAAYMSAGAGAGQFFNAGNTYTVTHTSLDGAYVLTLAVRLASANNRAHDAGNYSCTLTLTVSH